MTRDVSLPVEEAKTTVSLADECAAYRSGIEEQFVSYAAENRAIRRECRETRARLSQQ